jgi:hypothetical protein
LLDWIKQYTNPFEKQQIRYIVAYSFSNLLNFVFGYETNIAGIGEPLNFYIEDDRKVVVPALKQYLEENSWHSTQ